MPVRRHGILIPLVAMALAAGAASRARAQAGSAADSAADLGPTSAPPWNPPTPMPRAQGWEAALRLPGRVLTLPLSLLGKGTRGSLLFVEDNNAVPRALAIIHASPRIGVYAVPASLGDHTGTGVALEARPPVLRGILGGELSASTQHFHRTRVELALGPLGVDYLYEWRPRDQFFGIGPDSKPDSISEFAVQDQSIRAELTYPTQKPREAPPRVQASAWFGPRELVMRHGRGRKQSFEEVFPAVAAPQVDQRVENLIYGARAYVDTRGGMPHWTHGVRAEAQVDYFTPTEKELAFETASPEAPRLTRYFGGVVTGFSFMRDPRTIRLALRGSHQDVRSGSAAMRLYDLAGLGGNRGLYGFEPGRFYDLDMVVGQLTYIFPLAQHFELDVHTELGNVYHDMLTDPTWSSLRNSYGVLLRPRTNNMPLGMFGVDWSSEGIRFRFSIGGVQ